MIPSTHYFILDYLRSIASAIQVAAECFLLLRNILEFFFKFYIVFLQ